MKLFEIQDGKLIDRFLAWACRKRGLVMVVPVFKEVNVGAKIEHLMSWVKVDQEAIYPRPISLAVEIAERGVKWDLGKAVAKRMKVESIYREGELFVEARIMVVEEPEFGK